MDNDAGWKKFKKSLLFIAAIIPFAAAIGSLSTYIYEINFCNYFHIPTDWISISGVRSTQYTPLVMALLVPLFVARKPNLKYISSGIILAAILFYISSLTGVITSWTIAILLIILLFMIPVLQYLMYQLYSILKRRHRTDYQEHYKRTSMWLLIIDTFLIATFWTLKEVSHINISTSLLSIGTAALISTWMTFFISRAIENRSLWIATWLNRRAWWLEFKMLIRERTWWNIVANCCLIVILAFLIPFCYAVLGRGEAESGKFSVLSSNQSIVVLRIYDDRAVCAPLQNESGSYTLIEEFFTLPANNISLMPTQIGPLKTSN